MMKQKLNIEHVSVLYKFMKIFEVFIQGHKVMEESTCFYFKVQCKNAIF